VTFHAIRHDTDFEFFREIGQITDDDRLGAFLNIPDNRFFELDVIGPKVEESLRRVGPRPCIGQGYPEPVLAIPVAYLAPMLRILGDSRFPYFKYEIGRMQSRLAYRIED